MEEEAYMIITDTREQKPLFGEGESIREGLRTGDYSIVGFEDKFSIERKSMADLFQTVTRDHARFKREIERGLELDYFAIVVEGSWTDMLLNNFVGSSRTMVSGVTVAKIMSTIHIKYGVPIFFSNGRHESKLIIRELCGAFVRRQGALKV